MCGDYSVAADSRSLAWRTWTICAEAAVPDGVEELTEAEYRQYLTDRALQLMQAEFQPATWKAFWECVTGGRSAADVGAELGMSVAAVYAAKSRVLRRLREELDGLLD